MGRQSAVCIAALDQSVDCPESLLALAGQRWPGMQESSKAIWLLRWALLIYNASGSRKVNPFAVATTHGLLAQVLHGTVKSREDLEEAASLLRSATAIREKQR